MRLVITLCMLTAVAALSPSAQDGHVAEVRDAEAALRLAKDKKSWGLPDLLQGGEDLLDVLEDPSQSGVEVPVEQLQETLQDVLGKEDQEKREKVKKGWNEEEEIRDLKKALADYKGLGKKQSVQEILQDPGQSKKSGSDQSALDKKVKAGLASKKDGLKEGSKDPEQIVKREKEILKLLEEAIRGDKSMGLDGQDQETMKTGQYLLNILKKRLEEEPKNLRLMVSADPEGLYQKEEQFLKLLKEGQKDRDEYGRWFDEGSGDEEPFIPPALFKDLAKALGKLFAQSFLFFRDESKTSSQEDHPRDKRDLHPWQVIEETALENDDLQEMLGEEGLQVSAGDQSAAQSGQPMSLQDDNTEVLRLAFQIREVLRKKSKGDMQHHPAEELEERGNLANVLSEVLHLARELPDQGELTKQDEQLEPRSTADKADDDENTDGAPMEIEEWEGDNQALEILHGLNEAVQSDSNLRGLFDKISGELNRAENLRMEDNNLVQFVGHSLEEASKDDNVRDMAASLLSEEQGDQEAAGPSWDWFGNSLEVVKRTVSMLDKPDPESARVKRDLAEAEEDQEDRDTIVAESLRVYQMYLKDQDVPSKKSESFCRRTFSPCQSDADCCEGSCHRFVHKSNIMPYCG